jgi:hypothetical protein
VPGVEPLFEAIPYLPASARSTVLTGAAAETMAVMATDAEDARHHQCPDEGQRGEPGVVGGYPDGGCCADGEKSEEAAKLTVLHGVAPLSVAVDLFSSMAAACAEDVNARRRCFEGPAALLLLLLLLPVNGRSALNSLDLLMRQ